MTIAEAVAQVLSEYSRDHIGYGHCDTLDDAGSLVGMSDYHPLQRHARILDALARTKSGQRLFEKHMFRCTDGRAERLVRGFWLRESEKEEPHERD